MDGNKKQLRSQSKIGKKFIECRSRRITKFQSVLQALLLSVDLLGIGICREREHPKRVGDQWRVHGISLAAGVDYTEKIAAGPVVVFALLSKIGKPRGPLA